MEIGSFRENDEGVNFDCSFFLGIRDGNMQKVASEGMFDSVSNIFFLVG